MAFNMVEEALKAKKLPKEEKAQLANTLSEASGVEVKPQDLTPKNVEAVVKQEPTGTAKDKDAQRLLFSAIGAALPTLIGAAFGGAEGGAMGAQAGGQFVQTLGAQAQKEKEDQAKADAAMKQAAAQKEKEDKEFGFKQAELDIKKQEAGIKGTEREFKNIQDLRKEYEGNPVTKASRDVVTAFAKIKKAAEKPSAAGDLSLIFNYMKMLDPGSTVREGEFANAQNAGGVPTRILAAYNNALKGERLTDDQRKDFVGQSEGIFQAQLEQQKALESGFAAQAEKFGLNPQDVLLGGFEKQKPAPQFPRTVINPKTNQQAVVQNADELKEAMAEGFQ